MQPHSDSPTLFKTSRLMRTARKRVGLSQVEVAAHLGISQGALSKLEHGYLVPTAPQWFGFCELTSISPDCLVQGYLETTLKNETIPDFEKSGYRMNPKYLSRTGTKVRALLPWIQWIQNAIGEPKLEELYDHLGVDPDIWIDYDYSFSLELALDLFRTVTDLGILDVDSLEGFNRMLIAPRNHGSLAKIYLKEENPSDRLERLIRNAIHYEKNFHYTLETKSTPRAKQILEIKPRFFLQTSSYRNDPVLGDFLCQYKKLYFSTVPIWNSGHHAELHEKQCHFHGSDTCVYEIQFRNHDRKIRRLA